MVDTLISRTVVLAMLLLASACHGPINSLRGTVTLGRTGSGQQWSHGCAWTMTPTVPVSFTLKNTRAEVVTADVLMRRADKDGRVISSETEGSRIPMQPNSEWSHSSDVPRAEGDVLLIVVRFNTPNEPLVSKTCTPMSVQWGEAAACAELLNGQDAN